MRIVEWLGRWGTYFLCALGMHVGEDYEVASTYTVTHYKRCCNCGHTWKEIYHLVDRTIETLRLHPSEFNIIKMDHIYRKRMGEADARQFDRMHMGR